MGCPLSKSICVAGHSNNTTMCSRHVCIMCLSVYKLTDLYGTMQRREMQVYCFLLRMILSVVTPQKHHFVISIL